MPAWPFRRPDRPPRPERWEDFSTRESALVAYALVLATVMTSRMDEVPAQARHDLYTDALAMVEEIALAISAAESDEDDASSVTFGDADEGSDLLAFYVRQQTQGH